jgi:hypothetical protein
MEVDDDPKIKIKSEMEEGEGHGDVNAQPSAESSGDKGATENVNVSFLPYFFFFSFFFFFLVFPGAWLICSLECSVHALDHSNASQARWGTAKCRLPHRLCAAILLVSDFSDAFSFSRNVGLS